MLENYMLLILGELYRLALYEVKRGNTTKASSILTFIDEVRGLYGVKLEDIIK